MQTQRSHSRPDVNSCNSWDILHIQKSPEASNKTCVRLSLKQIPPNVSLDSFHTRACPLGILAREPRWRDVTNLSAPRILSKNAVQSRVWLWHGSYGGPDSWCDECELCVHMCGFQQLAKAHPWEDNLELVSHKIGIDKSINPYRNPFCASELDDLVPQIRTTSMVDMFWQKVLAKFLSSSFQFFGLHQAIWFYTRMTTLNLGYVFLCRPDIIMTFYRRLWVMKQQKWWIFCPGDRSIPIPISLFRLCESHCSKLQEAKGRGADDGIRDQIIGFDVLYIYKL